MGLVVDEPIRLGSASGRLQLQYREFRQLVDHPQYKPSACIRLSGSVSSRSKLVTPCFFKQVVAGHNDPNDWMDVACVAMSNGVTISVGTWLTTNARFIRQKAAQVRFRVILAPPAPHFPRVTQVTNLVARSPAPQRRKAKAKSKAKAKAKAKDAAKDDAGQVETMYTIRLRQAEQVLAQIAGVMQDYGETPSTAALVAMGKVVNVGEEVGFKGMMRSLASKVHPDKVPTQTTLANKVMAFVTQSYQEAVKAEAVLTVQQVLSTVVQEGMVAHHCRMYQMAVDTFERARDMQM